jgi:hypothetical protein
VGSQARQTAQLAGNQMYKKYPRQMLRSRVISEGIRTVYPGATSGLYEEGEVASFDDPKPIAAAIRSASRRTIRRPARSSKARRIEREKVPGITKIKNRLNAFMREGNKATEIEAFRALVKANKDDLKTIRDANHSYWTGDSEDFEGFEKWMERRYAELTPQEHSLEYQLLVSTLNECTSHQELQSWLTKNGDVIGTLDGEESRKFEALYDERTNPTASGISTAGGGGRDASPIRRSNR